MWRRPVALINARVWLGSTVARSVRFSTRVLSLDEPPIRGDVIVDLEGAWVLPGLVNAHDHLELNHFGLLKFRDGYDNATEWIDDMRPRLRSDPGIVKGLGHSLADRLLIGGLKNVLAGVTTVAHHNPLYPELRWRFPVNLVRRFGWAHSFALEGQPVGARGEPGSTVTDALRATAPDCPFIVHLAEGIDESAQAEFDRFEELGGLDRRSVIVHGVGLTSSQRERVRRRDVGVVWCPASNMFLFGRTLDVADLIGATNGASRRVALGTDSRVTGSRDILEELRCAARTNAVSTEALLHMVTSAAASTLALQGTGSLTRGTQADLCVLPSRGETPADALLAASRSDLLLVTVGGRPVIAHPRLAPVFEPRRTAPHPAHLDGEPKVLDRSLAHRIARSTLREPGLEVARA